jgi:hypothetical protein
LPLAQEPRHAGHPDQEGRPGRRAVRAHQLEETEDQDLVGLGVAQGLADPVCTAVRHRQGDRLGSIEILEGAAGLEDRRSD